MHDRRKIARVVRSTQVPEFMQAEKARTEIAVSAGDMVKDAEAKSAEILRLAEVAAAQTRDKIAAEWADHQRRMADVSAEVVGRVIDQRQMSEGARVISQTAVAAAAVRADFDALSPWLTELVETCVLRILGDIPASDRWGGTIRQSLKTIRSRWDLQLACNPADFDAISDIVARHPDLSGEGIQVKADYQLPPDTCILVHPDGAIDLSIKSLIGEICKYVDQITADTPIRNDQP